LFAYITGSELLIDGGVTAGFKGNTMPERERENPYRPK